MMRAPWSVSHRLASGRATVIEDSVEQYDALIRSGARRLTGYQRRLFQAGAFRKRRSLGAGFLCSQLLDDNRRFPTPSRQGERPWRSTNPDGGPNQRKSLSNRAIG